LPGQLCAQAHGATTSAAHTATAHWVYNGTAACFMVIPLRFDLIGFSQKNQR
jgi:hypothetical protein